MLNLKWCQCLFYRQDAGGNSLGRNEVNIKDEPNPSLNPNRSPNANLKDNSPNVNANADANANT